MTHNRPIGLPISTGLSGDGKLHVAEVPAGANNGLQLTDVSIPPPPGHVGSAVAVFVTDVGPDGRLAVGDRLLAINNRGLLASGVGTADMVTNLLAATAAESAPVVYQRLGTGTAELLKSVRASTIKSTVAAQKDNAAAAANAAGADAAAVNASHEASHLAELNAVKADLQAAETAKLAAEARADFAEQERAAEASAAEEVRAALQASEAKAAVTSQNLENAITEMEALVLKENGASEALEKADAASATSEVEIGHLQAQLEALQASAAAAAAAAAADESGADDGGAWGAKLAMKELELQSARNDAETAAKLASACQADADESAAALAEFQTKAETDAAEVQAALKAAKADTEAALSEAAAQAALAAEAAAAAASVVDADAVAEASPDVHSTDKGAVILGTMNIIGDATNPIEFMPNAADLAGLAGGVGSFERAQVTAAASLAAYTIADAKMDCGDTAEVSALLALFCASNGFDDTDSVAKLCSGKKLDLGLDNKWTDRLNPIVLGLSRMPDNPAVFQVTAASTDSDAYLAMVVGYYAAKWPAVVAGGGNASLSDSVAGLLLWDLLCADAVAETPAAFATLAEPSYLMEPGGGGGRGATAVAVAREALLTTLLVPLSNVMSANVGSSVIVGCQEMPSEVGPLESALPPGCNVYRAPVASGNITGFIFSSALAASFADVSGQIRPELLEYLEGKGVENKIRETTVRKLVVGSFTIPGRGRVVAVVFHCKSFKTLVAVQAEFVAHALSRAKILFGCEAYGVGDMNIEAKWAKGTSASDQSAAVQAAPLGKLPESTAANSHLFGKTLSEAGYTAYPEAGTITTLKMRTQFQGQPDKEGDLTAVHKDYVLVPAEESITITTVEIGGCPPAGTWSSNLDLLQPSRYWPADHFTILCVLGSSSATDKGEWAAKLALKETGLRAAVECAAAAQAEADETQAALDVATAEINRLLAAAAESEALLASSSSSAIGQDATVLSAAADEQVSSLRDEKTALQAEIAEAKAEAAAAQALTEEAKAALEAACTESDAHVAALEEASRKEDAAAAQLRETAASEAAVREELTTAVAELNRAVAEAAAAAAAPPPPPPPPSLQDASPEDRAAAALKGHPSGCYVVWKAAAVAGSNSSVGDGLRLSVMAAGESVHCIPVESKSDVAGNSIYWLDTAGSTDCRSLGSLIQHHRVTPFTDDGLLLAWAVSMGSTAPSSVRHVSVNRLPGRQFGFVLVGNADADGNSSSYVRLVGRRDAAAAGLVTGDKVIALNGVSVSGVSHREVYQRLQEHNESRSIELAVQLDGDGARIVARAVEAAVVSSGSPREINIVGCRANPEGLGISILSDEKNRILICEITVGGAAALSNTVDIGDQILSCHGVDFQGADSRGYSHDDALETLSLARDEVHMVVASNQEAWDSAVQKEWMEWPSSTSSAESDNNQPRGNEDGEGGPQQHEQRQPEQLAGETTAAEVAKGARAEGDEDGADHGGEGGGSAYLDVVPTPAGDGGGDAEGISANILVEITEADEAAEEEVADKILPVRGAAAPADQPSTEEEIPSYFRRASDAGDVDTDGNASATAGAGAGGVGGDVGPKSIYPAPAATNDSPPPVVLRRRASMDGSPLRKIALARANFDEQLNFSVVGIDHGGGESELHVAGVQPGSAAELAGLRDGDMIVGVGGNATPVTVQGFRDLVTSQLAIEIHSVREEHDDTLSPLQMGAGVSGGQQYASPTSFIGDSTAFYSDLDQDAADAAEEETNNIVRQASVSRLALSPAPEWHRSKIDHDPVATIGQRLLIDVGNSLYGEDVSDLPFTIKGGSNTPYGAPFVVAVEDAAMGFAASGKCVDVGDRILAINDVSVIQLTEAEVHQQLTIAMEDMTAPCILFVLRSKASIFAGVKEDVQAIVADARAGGAALAEAANGMWVRPMSLALGDLPEVSHPRVGGPERDLTSDLDIPLTAGEILMCTLERAGGSLGLSVVPMLGSTFVIKTISEASRKLLEYGDRILSVNGACMSIGTPKDCTLALKRAGESVHIVVHRVGLQAFNK